MPKVRRSRKPPPDGWELIEPTLEELEQKMREGNKRNFVEFNERFVNVLHFHSRNGATRRQAYNGIAVADL